MQSLMHLPTSNGARSYRLLCQTKLTRNCESSCALRQTPRASLPISSSFLRQSASSLPRQCNTRFAHPISHSSRSYSSKSSSDPHPDAHIHVGLATRTLRSNFPSFLSQGLANTDIYSSSITLVEPYHTRFCCRGKKWYRSILGLLRWSLKIFFAEAELHIISLQQNRVTSQSFAPPSHLQNQGTSQHDHDKGDDEDGTTHPALKIRWMFEGTSRISLLLNGMDASTAPRSIYEGLFIYSFDRDGFISEHRIEGIHPSPPLMSGYRWWRGYSDPVAPNMGMNAQVVRIPHSCRGAGSRRELS
ncbi:hypothetical protein DFS34DRAFT_627486, partial [Phlyctochytrium arcticum]